MENILVLDSGIGGLSTAKILKKKHPNFNYIYFKDTFNCPYGNKSKEELLLIALNNINFVLKRYKIKAVVLACNTLSTNVKKRLQNTLKIPIFAVTPPIEHITAKALVLSTNASFKALTKGLVGEVNKFSYITTLKTKINGNEVVFCAMHTLALEIEKNIKKKNYLLEYLKNVLKPLKYESFKQIVLGCTHYNYVKEELGQIFTKVKFLEGSSLVNLNSIK